MVFAHVRLFQGWISEGLAQALFSVAQLVAPNLESPIMNHEKNWLYDSACFFGLIFFCCSISNAEDDLRNRLDIFMLERHDLDRCMSVLVEKVHFSEGNFGPLGRRLSTRRVLQQVAISIELKAERMDGISLNPTTGESVGIAFPEHLLLLKNRGFYHLRHRSDGDDTAKIIEFERREGAIPVKTRTILKHPFEILTSQGAGNSIDGGSGSVFNTRPQGIIEAKDLVDGRRFIKYYTSNQSARAITFSKDDFWRIEQTDFFMNENVSSIRSKPEDLKHYATTKASWKKSSDSELFLPEMVQIDSNDGRVEEKWEIRFTEWRFGGSVDKSLFDTERFTADELGKSVDFNRIKKVFDKSK